MSDTQIPSDSETSKREAMMEYNLAPKFIKDINSRIKSRKRDGTQFRNSRFTHHRNDLLNLKNFRFTEKCISVRGQLLSIEELDRKTIYLNGNKIIGKWKNNQLHGFVVIDYESGEHFEGKYDEGIRVQGLLRFKDGTQYQGHFLEERFHGHGRLTDPSKRKILCQWNRGVPGRKGTIQYPSRDVYYGQIQKLKKHGEGYIFFRNGYKFFGSFVQGRIQGFGKYYKGDSKVAEGVWSNGVLLIDQFVKNVLCETLTRLTTTGIGTQHDFLSRQRVQKFSQGLIQGATKTQS